MRRLLLALLLALPVVATQAVPAEATCSGSTCSQIKNADHSAGRIMVYCQNVGFTSSYYLAAGQTSGCGRYAYAFEAYFPYNVWCRPLGVNTAYTYWGGPGRYNLPGTGSVNCKLV